MKNSAAHQNTVSAGLSLEAAPSGLQRNLPIEQPHPLFVEGSCDCGASIRVAGPNDGRPDDHGSDAVSPEPGTASGQEAQAWALRAMRTAEPEVSSRFALQALELDPFCVDALVHMAYLECGTRGDLVEQLRIAVNAGERALGGPAWLRANQGGCWAVPRGRPYLRARALLARLLVDAGRPEEAVGHYEELLQLDADDHLGIRDHLLACCFRRNDLAGVRRLLSRFQSSGGVVFAWAAVLERLLSGDMEAAADALRDARRANRRVEAYLTSRRAIPKTRPNEIDLHEEREAIFCNSILGPAWRKRGKAVDWLKRIT